MERKQTMQAAVFEREGSLILKEVGIPRIERPDQVLIRVEAASICGTDVHITRVPAGYIATPNTILGHEFVGVIEEVGSEVKTVKPGDRVVVNPNDYCGVCQSCRANLPTLCRNIIAMGIDKDGAFAEYVTTTEKVVYKIAKTVSPEAAACAEPLACALNGFGKVQLKAGWKVAVIGAGPIGLMMAMLLRHFGMTDITIFEVQEYRKRFARELGFEKVIDSRTLSGEEKDAMNFDAVYEMTGSQMPMAVQITAVSGHIVLFGVNKKAVSTVRQSEITTREITVHGTWLANGTFPAAVKLLEEGKLPIGRLVTDVVPLRDVKEGIEKLARGEAIKVIVKP